MPWTNYIKWAVIAILSGILFYAHVRDKQAAVNAIKLQYSQELTKQQELARKKEKELTDNAVQLRNNKDEEIATVNGKLTNALRMLSARKSRPANPPTTSVGETCTGSQLYREDAEFLAGEAARAEKVRIERDYYYERYESARKSLAGKSEDVGSIGEATNSEPIP